MSQNETRIDPYQHVTDRIIEQLERGTVPWRRPWNPHVGLPRNFHTGKVYCGANILLLGLHGFASPYWMTFCQTKERGGAVRKGERAAMVIKYGEYVKNSSESGDSQLKPKGFYLRCYHVFNAVQIEGIEFPDSPAVPQPNSSYIERAQEIAVQMPLKPALREGRSIRASYTRTTDTVEMPPLTAFDTPKNFYLTLFHELIHATGHPMRLNRKSLVEHNSFGKKLYSEEELVAEMGAAFLAVEADIVQDDHAQSAAYLQGWLTALRSKDHRRWIVQAANHAGRAADFILRREPIGTVTA